MKYLVVYSSRTGNTERIAREIFQALPGTSKDLQKIEEQRGEAETYFVGFWNDKGICSSDIMEFLEGLHRKQVALFGTCGMGEDRNYCRQVARRVEALIPEDNRYPVFREDVASGAGAVQDHAAEAGWSRDPPDDTDVRRSHAPSRRERPEQCQNLCQRDRA